jgi:ribosomal-protein-alanine N-acetyltransferase
MSSDSTNFSSPDWRRELPILAAFGVALREPTVDDVLSLTNVLAGAEASRFGVDEHLTEAAVKRFVDRVTRDRAAGLGFTYVVTASTDVVGLIQVRQLDPAFEAAEWEMTLVPAARGTGIFMEAARLVGSFVFETLGTHRLEARVLQQNGRAIGALRKIGAVQEGLLRRSIRRGDTYLDQVLWSILREDWSDQHPSTAPRIH